MIEGRYFADLGLVRLALVTLVAVTIGVGGRWTEAGDPRLAATGRDDDVTIWVADNGFHTDLILPRAYLSEGGGPLGQAVDSLDPGSWVAVGWGDARFYPDPRPVSERLLDGLRAFLWPGNPSVVLLDPTTRPPGAIYRPGSLHQARLSRAGFLARRRRLSSSLAVQNHAPLRGPASRVGNGQFFLSVESFWIGHLCNHWSAELLHAGGLPVRPGRTIFSAEIVRMAHSADATPGMRDR